MADREYSPSERDIDEIPVDIPDDEAQPDEGELDPEDTHVEGATRRYLRDHPDKRPESWSNA